jgi:hypothetical protein
MELEHRGARRDVCPLRAVAIHGLILTLTFQSFVGPKPFWSSAWRISERRRRWARGVLAGAAMLCIGIVTWGALVSREPHDEKLLIEIAVLTLASLAT